MFRVLALQTLYTLSDDQTEYPLRDQLSFMRFAGLALHDAVPEAKTIWLFRQQLTRAGPLARLFERFDRLLHDRGYLAMGGQIIDATVVEARRPRLTKHEKAILGDGGTPSEWSKARSGQVDRDGRWTLKRGNKTPLGGAQRQAVTEIALPLFGYKNHVGVDRSHGFIRRFTVTHAPRHDGGQLAAVLDPANTASEVWADTAYRSKANLAAPERRGLVAQFQRAKRARQANAAPHRPRQRDSGAGAQPGSGVWDCSCAALDCCARARRSRSPTSPITCPDWCGSKRKPRPREPAARARRRYTGKIAPASTISSEQPHLGSPTMRRSGPPSEDFSRRSNISEEDA